ncbi:hypothetical protein ACS0TY_035971 [Phlomoides rotata]
MDDAVDTSYQPPAGFEEDKKDPLVDFELTDSTELWLIQWPINQPSDFDGQRVSLKLDGDGQIGTFEGSSGKSYDVVSYKTQGPEASVILSSASEAKIAGKITRRVSLIHYPEPSELLKRNNLDFGQSQRSSMATSSMSGRVSATPSRSIRPKNSQGMSGYSTPINRTKSTISGMGDLSKSTKRKRVDDQRRSSDHSAQDSGKGNSGVTSTESMEHSQEKPKKKKKSEK